MSNDIKRKYGATAPQVVTFKDKTTGKPISVSGWSDIQLYIDSKKVPGDNTTRVAVLNGVIGVVVGEVKFPVATQIPIGTYYYQVKFTDADGYIDITDSGVWLVEQVIAK